LRTGAFVFRGLQPLLRKHPGVWGVSEGADATVGAQSAGVGACGSVGLAVAGHSVGNRHSTGSGLRHKTPG
jgi:hypothetical protein